MGRQRSGRPYHICEEEYSLSQTRCKPFPCLLQAQYSPTDENQEFLLRVKRKGGLEYFVGRRYGDFSRLYKKLRTELPGKVLPPIPKKNKSNSTTSNLLGSITGKDDSDVSSLSSASTQMTGAGLASGSGEGGQKMLSIKGRVSHAD